MALYIMLLKNRYSLIVIFNKEILFDPIFFEQSTFINIFFYVLLKVPFQSCKNIKKTFIILSRYRFRIIKSHKLFLKIVKKGDIQDSY